MGNNGAAVAVELNRIFPRVGTATEHGNDEAIVDRLPIGDKTPPMDRVARVAFDIARKNLTSNRDSLFPRDADDGDAPFSGRRADGGNCLFPFVSHGSIIVVCMLKLPPLTVIDRASGTEEREKIYGEWGLALLYETWVGRLLQPLFAHTALLSRFYGWLQDRPASRKKVAPFCETFGVDVSEFAKPVESFTSFNNFFSRKLKPESRPIAEGAVIPADGRYLFFQEVGGEEFRIKGQRFSIASLLGDEVLAKRYEGGAMAIARLCPTDYHRFHFPVDGRPGEALLVKGQLASVNPVALAKTIGILSENRRMRTLIESERHGTVAMVEVGATMVGSIIQTYQPMEGVRAGDEKGTFAFGGSAIVLLFEPGCIRFSDDLLAANAKGFEVKCLMGQPLDSIFFPSG